MEFPLIFHPYPYPGMKTRWTGKGGQWPCTSPSYLRQGHMPFCSSKQRCCNNLGGLMVELGSGLYYKRVTRYPHLPMGMST